MSRTDAAVFQVSTSQRTVDATTTELDIPTAFVSGGGPAQAVGTMEVYVQARSAISGDGLSCIIESSWQQDDAATITLVGVPIVWRRNTSGAASWTCTVAASLATGVPSVQFGGAASTLIHWSFAFNYVIWQGFPTTNATAAEAMDASETGFDVSDGTKFVAGQVIVVDNEMMTIGSISGNTLTVSRGSQSSTAATHSNGATIYTLVLPFWSSALNLTADEEIDATETDIDVVSSAGVSAGLYRIEAEQITVSSVAGNTLTVIRGVNGTVATTHVAGINILKWDIV